MHNISIKYINDGSLWQSAGEKLSEEIRLSVEAGRKTLVLLSGGSATKIYRYINFTNNQDPKTNNQIITNNQTSITKLGELVCFGQVDERYHPGIKNQESRIKEINSYIIEQTGLWGECERLGIPYHLISQEGSLEESAGKYDRLMKKLFAGYEYRIAVLGIGTDGHTAGMLPGYGKDWNQEPGIPGLAKRSGAGKNQGNIFFTGYQNDGVFKERITVTAAGLGEMDYAIVVAGAEKGNIIKGILSPRPAIFSARGSEKKKASRGRQESGITGPDLDSFPALVFRQMKRVEVFSEYKENSLFGK